MKIKQIALLVLFSFSLLGATAQRISIMSYNVRNARGLDGVLDLDRTAEVIRAKDAQFVALQELDSITGRSGGLDILSELANRTGMHASYARAIPYDGGAYGIGLLSKEIPVRTERVKLLGREEARVLLVVEFENYVICCTHFSLTAADQLASINKIVDATKKYDKPLFLVGDLNFEPDSRQFDLLTKSFALLSNPLEPTFPADKPTQTIDYIWGSPKYKYKIHKQEVVLAPEQSDHRPIFIKLTYSKK